MPPSGASPSELSPPAIGQPRRTLGNAVRLGLFGGIVVALLAAVAICLEVSWSSGLVCLTATGALVAAALPLAMGRGGDLAEPIWLVVLTVAVGTTGKAFYLVLGPPERVGFLLRGTELGSLLPAALVIALGMAFLSFGYLCGSFRWRLPGLARLRTGVPDARRYLAVVGVLAVAGMFAFLAFASRFDVSMDGLAGLSSKRLVLLRGSRSFLVHGYLRWGALLLETAFFLLFVRWAASGRRLRSALGVAVLLLGLGAAVFPFFVSSREGVMYLILRMGLIWLYLRGEPAPRKALAVAVAALALFGSMLALRRERSDWAGIRQHVGVEGLLESTVGGRHFLDLTKTAHVIAGVPQVVGYQHGKTLVTWMVAPVPRAWWAEKPRIGAGGDLSPIFGTPWTSGVPPGIVAELYFNFGYFGILVGMVAAGVGLRSLYETLRPRLGNPQVVLVYAFLATRIGFGMMSTSVSGSAIRLLQEMVPLTVALALCLRPAAEVAPEGAGTPPAAEARG